MAVETRVTFRAGIVLAALLAAAVLAASEQATRELRFVSPLRPPFTDEPGNLRFGLDLVEAALGRINVKPRTTIVPSGQYGEALLKGPFDGTAFGWRDAERERVRF